MSRSRAWTHTFCANIQFQKNRRFNRGFEPLGTPVHTTCHLRYTSLLI